MPFCAPSLSYLSENKLFFDPDVYAEFPMIHLVTVLVVWWHVTEPPCVCVQVTLDVFINSH